MKRVRAIRKKNHGRKNNMSIIFFVILMATVAIYAGLKITEEWVTPVLDTTIDQDEDIQALEIQETKSEPTKSSDTYEKDATIGDKEIEAKDIVTDEIRSFSIHMIQIASLTDAENIEQLVKYLDEKKLPHLVYKKNDSYKIYTKGFIKREHAKYQLDEIMTHFPDAFIFTKHLFDLKLEFEKAEVNSINGEIITNFNELLGFMEAQSEILYNYYKKEGELDLYVELLTKQQTLLDTLSDNVNKLPTQNNNFRKKEIENMIQYQKSNIEYSKNLLTNIENVSMYKVHSLFLDSLFRVVDAID
ncbi:MAG: hypothetical protein COA82_01495 [Alkaliphilus sp.]|nr:MAG: hypothetical protein COA82_01495 [Alkaliphilus sp.]